MRRGGVELVSGSFLFLRVNEPIECLGDSMLVVQTVSGKWKLKATHLIPRRDRIQNLMKDMNCKVKWIPREENERTDMLSTEAYKRWKRLNSGYDGSLSSNEDDIIPTSFDLIIRYGKDKDQL